MEILSLNTEHGKHLDDLLKFVERQAKTVDVFCFQEVAKSSLKGVFEPRGYQLNLYSKLQKTLKRFNGYHDSYTNGLAFTGEPDRTDLQLGNAYFVREGLSVRHIGAPFVVGTLNQLMPCDGSLNWPTLLQMFEVEVDGQIIRIGNFHGVSQPGDKKDNPQRLEQSKKIIELLKEYPKVVVLGDFNLAKDTESVRMFSEAGYRDLIREHNIPTTRSTLTPYYGTPQQQDYADYTFTKGLTIDGFWVLSEKQDEVSDHLALKTQISV